MHTFKVVDSNGQAAGLSGLRKPRPVKTIAVTGGKGGVGKTNICANLAVALAMRKKRVLLLDADFGLANVDILFRLQPKYTLNDVINGQQRLQEIIVSGPAGVEVVPGSSGLSQMVNLTPAQHAGLVHSFSELEQDLDILLIDTAPGTADGVLRFAAAAHEVILVVCDEPTSITDAYATIKLLYRNHGVDRFQVVTNMSRNSGDAARLFSKLCRITGRFLPVVLYHAGSLPYDDRVWQAVQRQTPLVTAFPGSLATIALKKLAARADNWEVPRSARGKMEFFVERLFELANGPEELVS